MPTGVCVACEAWESELMNLEALSIGAGAPDQVNVVIEVPIGGEPIKYEFDKASGALVVDRFLYTPMRYPGNYGFIPKTLSEDGDPCDVLVANSRALIPGAVIAVRPIGVLIMQDEAGPDEKIIAVPVSRLTRRYDSVIQATDLPAISLKQIEHFFEHYKDLEKGKWVKVLPLATTDLSMILQELAIHMAVAQDETQSESRRLAAAEKGTALGRETQEWMGSLMIDWNLLGWDRLPLARPPRGATHAEPVYCFSVQGDSVVSHQSAPVTGEDGAEVAR